jgi:tRNA nucleotidyltransferase (CCA-adding enzyme)
MNTISEILEAVLKEITPTNRELTIINEIVERLKFLLEKKAKVLKIEYTRIEPQGSTGIKQTQLRNDFDIDLFVGLNYDLYKPKYEGLSKNKLRKASKKDFLKLCNEWILKALDLKEFQNPRLLYAEHPYVTVDYFTQNIKIEVNIVLYFDLDLNFIKKNGPITAVDRSPWHGNFVRDNLTNDQKNDVRLLKQFFKSCHSYGDKSPVGKVGFIGYSAELLIYYFGSIQKLFENFNNLKENPLDYFNRNKTELEKITHFQNDFLIITDPIDKNRNVASAISEKAYKYCNQRVKTFLNNPNIDFFKINPITEADLSNSVDPILLKTYILEFNSKNNGVHYTIYRDKLYSLGDSIKVNGEKEFSHASRFGNIVFEVYFEDVKKEYNLAIFCGKPIISASYIRRGPPIKEKFHADQFKEKNPNYFKKKGYLWVETKRNFNDFFEFLKDFVRKKIPEHLNIVNISISFDVKTTSGKRAIYILKEMVIPFYKR